MDTVFYPDYRHSILNITNTILHYYGVKTPYADLTVLQGALARRPKNIILLILDGMGVDLISKTLPENAFLRRHVQDEISSVFPPTTTTATTTYYSGLPPISHGWLGWAPYFKECNRSVEIFTNLDNYTQEPAEIVVSDLLPYTHIFNRIRQQNKKVNLTKVFPDNIEPTGVKTFSELVKRILKQSEKSGEQFILSYWPEPDHTCHKNGTYAKSVIKKMTFFNRKIQELSQKLSDSVLIVSADHGHIPATRYVYLDDYPDIIKTLVAPISLEDRAAAVFVKPGCHQAFEQAYQKHLSADFLLMSATDIVGKGLLGEGEQHRKVADFLGDYVLIAKGETTLRQRLKDSKSEPMKSVHAGLSRREMVVPLIIADCPSEK